MKNFLFLLIVPFFVIISCQKEEKTYSCDSNINNWVKNNLVEINNMTRNDLISRAPEEQRAIFRAFSSKQRFQLWFDKINEVLTLDWSENEKTHILLLRNSLQEEWFSENTKNDSLKCKSIKLYIKNWYKEGIEKFGWTRKLIGGMIARTEKLTDKQGSLTINPLTVSSPADCTCSPISDWCPDYCGGAWCESSSWGCGTLFLYDCLGKCKEYANK